MPYVWPTSKWGVQQKVGGNNTSKSDILNEVQDNARRPAVLLTSQQTPGTTGHPTSGHRAPSQLAAGTGNPTSGQRAPGTGATKIGGHPTSGHRAPGLGAPTIGAATKRVLLTRSARTPYRGKLWLGNNKTCSSYYFGSWFGSESFPTYLRVSEVRMKHNHIALLTTYFCK